MKILVINTGSSSIKYQLFDMDKEIVMASGLMERIGEDASLLTHKRFLPSEKKKVDERRVADHEEGMNRIVELLTDNEYGAIHDKKEIGGVGHRVVHGGESFKAPTVIDDKVIKVIKENVPLAPLHNPGNLVGIEASRALFPDVKQVAVFDTAFHQTIPEYAFRYALPENIYKEYHVRRYGFHGTSHRFVSKEAAKFLGKSADEVNLITIHLGNGASIAAVRNGKSVDTSMGMTPLEGVIMGTRSGDLDPAIHFYLANTVKMTLPEIDVLFNKKSGLKGICGINDMRDIEAQSQQGNKQTQLAIDMYTYRIKKYIGMYTAALGNVDALVFTAGIGENSSLIREKSCEGLGILGVEIDKEKNSVRTKENREIQSDNSKIKVLVVPTNEELEIAEETIEEIEK